MGGVGLTVQQQFRSMFPLRSVIGVTDSALGVVPSLLGQGHHHHQGGHCWAP